MGARSGEDVGCPARLERGRRTDQYLWPVARPLSPPVPSRRGALRARLLSPSCGPNGQFAGRQDAGPGGGGGAPADGEAQAGVRAEDPSRLPGKRDLPTMAVLAAMKIPPLTPRPRRRVVCALALAVWVAASGRLRRQTNLEPNAGVQFNFSPRGAGNLVLGGPFLALAFDASAAYTNPAGLTTIIQPEALIETRYWNYTHVFTDHGKFNSDAGTVAGLRDGEARNQITGLSFASYVY